ncbi:alpha/beta hydrolase [Nocardia sp. NEAU-G5]|uniref:Alpha/beta hydrolase n=1 Tax=Nocardia albiluteola TaxID=2842303 RepID=A0ABS6B3E4_9NOCA|nr:alpha/beta fold hydrolase [Nocardia albiluteola]MBU3064276.1 alpha/beta hydrolase [Nocardia albiluteola]
MSSTLSVSTLPAREELDRRLAALPIGYHDLHPDASVNYQMNRFYSWVGGPTMLSEMREAVAGVDDYPTFARIFLGLGEKALSAGENLKGAAYIRIAEFFLPTGDDRKLPTRDRFVRTVLDHYRVPAESHGRIPFQQGWLSAYRFTPAESLGTIVVFGGFDSYIEEWLAAGLALRDAGYDVVLFEGPGQGATLEEAHVPFQADWQTPVAAVLDFYDLDDVTLMGFSMGGGLVLRAAAHEPRVRRTVSYGVMTSFLDVNLHIFPESVRAQLLSWLDNGDAAELDDFMSKAAAQSLLLEWAIEQGKHTTATDTTFEMFQTYRDYETASISARVTQDVLLLHGNEDHYIPNQHFVDQVALLTATSSLTARVFTRHEQAQNHCQVGNFGLALRTIIDWLDSLRRRDDALAAS